MTTHTNQANSIATSQTQVHEKLDTLVKRYQQAENLRPVSAHTRTAFEQACAWLGDWNGDIIIDSCCGVGESTARLGAANPQAKVIGLDKSQARLDKHSHYQRDAKNYAVFRADVIDFWRLIRQHHWHIQQHYLLYPNPYPKSSQVQKRWHGSAAFVDLMAMTPNITVRSNWLVYLLEFSQAAGHYQVAGNIQQVHAKEAFTPFERKYLASGQTCWELICRAEEEG